MFRLILEPCMSDYSSILETSNKWMGYVYRFIFSLSHLFAGKKFIFYDRLDAFYPTKKCKISGFQMICPKDKECFVIEQLPNDGTSPCTSSEFLIFWYLITYLLIKYGKSKLFILYPVIMSGSDTRINSAQFSKSFSSFSKHMTSLPTIFPQVLSVKTFLISGSVSP